MPARTGDGVNDDQRHVFLFIDFILRTLRALRCRCLRHALRETFCNMAVALPH